MNLRTPVLLFADGDAPPPIGQQTQPASNPPTQGGTGQPGGAANSLLMFAPILLMVVMVLWMSRSQKNKQRQLEESLKVGDRVVLQGGIIGKIVKLMGARATVEIAPGVNVEVYKSAITGPDAVDARPDAKTEAKPAESKK